jgi:hypothetical protein
VEAVEDGVLVPEVVNHAVWVGCEGRGKSKNESRSPAGMTERKLTAKDDGNSRSEGDSRASFRGDA